MTYISEKLRQAVKERSTFRCEYCRLHESDGYFPHEIDHIYAEKHGGETLSENLCLACADCNRYKGSNLCSLDPQTGEITALFHPRQNDWHEHFTLRNDGNIQAITARGRVTIRVLSLNRSELVAERIRLIKLGKYA